MENPTAEIFFCPKCEHSVMCGEKVIPCAVAGCTNTTHNRSRLCDKHHGRHCPCGSVLTQDGWCELGCNGALTKCRVTNCLMMKPKGFGLCRSHYHQRNHQGKHVFCLHCGAANCQLCHRDRRHKEPVEKQEGWCPECDGPLAPCKVDGCARLTAGRFSLCNHHDRLQFCRDCYQHACKCSMMGGAADAAGWGQRPAGQRF